MKAFEVKLVVIGGYENQTVTGFVEANSKRQLTCLDHVLKVWVRKDMKPEECPMQVIDNVICHK